MAASLHLLSDTGGEGEENLFPNSCNKRTGGESHGPGLGHVPIPEPITVAMVKECCDWLGLVHILSLHWNKDGGKSFIQTTWTKVRGGEPSPRRPGDTHRKKITAFYIFTDPYGFFFKISFLF